MDGVLLRSAGPDDVPALVRFGEQVVPAHYAPLIGEAAARAQVRDWWRPEQLAEAVAAGQVVLAEDDGALVGMAQRGRWGADDVVWKLYVHPDQRGAGLGPRLLAEVTRGLDGGRVLLEHFAANERAAAFYEREGFVVDHVETSAVGDVVWRVRGA
ncbi:GNAT family N-acetyltransferase [Klenkia brasiliensis]|uniref:Acetyltransferase (GNAT) domain-containing protein n=1 Tax=Klenkia brasiliensis TaxID=333142 RepID=A0A1G7XD08_9ACTN|nr:GNAT family N-acetyltransferase [Klenkia brasiliensis]SDG82004.1 Acetyltransferase (GNAT) domain-containing protein [Klenkia brasiliensis]